MKTAASFLSTNRAIWLLAVAALMVFLGVRLIGAPAPTGTARLVPPTGPTGVERIARDVAYIRWNGGPKDGYVISHVLPIQVGDRIEIFWRGGCLTPLPKESCYQPWGFLDVLAENEALFRFQNGAFAVHIVQGNGARIVWPRGEDRMVFTVRSLPVRLSFNTIVRPGIYASPAMRADVPVNGYNPPFGTLAFRIVNRH